MNDLYLTNQVQLGLEWYYILLAVLNLGFAAFWFRHRKYASGAVWCVVAALRSCTPSPTFSTAI